MDHIHPVGLAIGNAEAEHEGLASGGATINFVAWKAIAATIVLEGILTRGRFGAAHVELGGRAEAAVDVSALEHPLRVGAVAFEVRTLENDVFVPVKPEPLKAFEDGARGFVRGACAIGVFDAEQELAAEFAGEEPVEERGAGAAHVEVAGGRGGETEARGGRGGHRVGRSG